MHDDFDMLAFVSRHKPPVLEFDAGETVFLKGDSAERLFVVDAGRVDILMFGRVLERIGPGGLFGEMALIDDRSRSAAALTLERCRVHAIDKPTFLKLVGADPRFALHVIDIMTKRLTRIAAMREATAKR
ncbi:MAG: cyclic nucleotide-binding domain-containing protein [Hyphomicrobiaceae bacterium]|nr:cyclic nucleotide-binding domain-containing protein [Hyphomicrobiaceae bacterium]